MMIKPVYLCILTLVLQYSILNTEAITAYDCTHPSMNMTSLSLLDSGDCKIPLSSVKETSRTIIVLQQAETLPITIYQCKVTYTRMIHHCGFMSHISPVVSGFGTVVRHLTKEQCKTMIINGFYEFMPSTPITNLQVNKTARYRLNLAGSIDGNTCEGGTYLEAGQEWKNVVVQSEVTINIRKYNGYYSSSEGIVRLPSGLVCSYSKQECEDLDVGSSFWDLEYSQQCGELDYQVIYKGPSFRVELSTNNSNTMLPTYGVVYNVVNKENLFSLKIVGDGSACMFQALTTDYPRILVIDITGSDITYFKNTVDTMNVNMFTFFNAKIAYVERHLKAQLISMYHDMIMKQCILDKKIMSLELSMATLSPTEFAYIYAKEPGYTSVVMGEIIYLFKCIAVDVAVVNSDACTVELPVNHTGTIMYMAPKTHILQKMSTPATCSIILKPGFKILGNWYSTYPTLHNIEDPNKIQSSIESTWKYINPGNLANSGIYTLEAMEALRKQVMFSTERLAIGESIVFDSVHNTLSNNGVSFTRYIDENKILASVHNYMTSIYGWLVTFGSISSGAIGLYVIMKILVFVLDTIIHAYHLKMLYGWSWWILGMFCNSLTMCLFS